MQKRLSKQPSRRELFRVMGAGTAALLTPAFSPRAHGASGAAPKAEETLCWTTVNEMIPERTEAWQKAMAFWQEAKFGMFIHWGPVSQASVEISWPIMVPNSRWPISEDKYVNLYKTFNPSQYDPDAWVELAKDAGQRYMVMVTKHHDGFCMFDSSFTDYKITNTPYKKDIVRMLADACQRQNMALGFYYSPPDMHHPGYRDTAKAVSQTWHAQPTRPEWPVYLDYMGLQLRELLCHYGPGLVVWFDGLDHQQKYDGYRFARMIREFSPGTLINNRIGIPGDFDTPEQWVPKRIPVKGVTLQGTNPDLANSLPGGIPAPGEFKPWETNMTINNTWAYNKNDHNYKSTTQLIRTLVDVASKGGNFLLNVGPTPEGTIQPEFQDRLRGIGKWMRVNGESIYGTTYGPLQDLSFGRTTAKGSTVYLQVFDWPRGGRLEIPGLRARIRQVRLLENGQPLKFAQSVRSVAIDGPQQAPDARVSVLKLTTA
jgi:alpha-L-fucosidase